MVGKRLLGKVPSPCNHLTCMAWFYKVQEHLRASRYVPRRRYEDWLPMYQDRMPMQHLRRGVGQPPDDVIKNDQEGHLKEHRQAATSWAHTVFLVEPHHLFIQLLAVLWPLVFLLKLLDLGLQPLHCHHRFRALHR